MSDSSSRIPPLGLAVLLLIFSLWAGWFIHRSSFKVEGTHYYCLFDDAMISMTYARNLVEGHGLEWARFGEPVEGFTHPLWMFLMVPVNLLPIALKDRSLPMQLLSWLCLAGTIAAVRRLMLDHFSPPGEAHWLPAAVLTAFYYPLAYWSLMGMETGLQALLAVVAVQLALTTAHSDRDRNFSLWIVCAAAFLLRMDMLLMVGAVQLYVLLQRGFRQIRTRSWLAGFALFCGMTLAYGIFRKVYYHDLLPNTYYLKLYGVPLAVRLLRGTAVLAEFVRDHLLVLLAAGLGTAAFLRRNKRLILPAALFVLYCAYSVYVGGDAWDDDLPIRANRFISFVMPFLFVLLNATLNEALAVWRGRRGREIADGDPAGRLVLGAATVVALLIVNGLWLSDKANDNWRELALVNRPPMTQRHQRVVGQLVAFEKLVKPGATVATAWAGIPAYFSNYKMIDILGYNDRVIAHSLPVTPLDEDNFDTFRPGHSKWNEQRLLAEQKPDAFFQIWGIKRGMGPVAKVMPGYGYRRRAKFWVRMDSPFVDLQNAPPPPPEDKGDQPNGDQQPAPDNAGDQSNQGSGGDNPGQTGA